MGNRDRARGVDGRQLAIKVILIEPRDYFRLLLRLALPILALLLALIPVHLGRAQGDFSLRFYGTGRDGVDRVMIPLDAPPRPVDVGGDFTIEFWLKAIPAIMRRQPALPARTTGSTAMSSSTAMSTLPATMATTVSRSQTGALCLASITDQKEQPSVVKRT